jgi:hypothetical protein
MSSAGINVNHRNGLPRGFRLYIRMNRRELEWLPEPGEQWIIPEVDNPESAQIHDLQQNHIIKQVDSRYIEDNHYRYRVYETTEEAWKYLKFYREEAKRDRILPCSDVDCPGNAFRNDGGDLICKDCGEAHDPEQVQ